MPASRPKRAPVSTYRLQLNPQFTFSDARDIPAYLQQLGVTECYSSPLLAARPGSEHGYDISDHSRLNPELGGEEGFRDFAGELQRRDLGLILDFVPNHMGVDPQANPWWRDVLRNGPSAPSARFFDIDWEPIVPALKGKLLLPILGGQYGDELEAGKLQIDYSEGDFSLRYYDHNLPLNPRPMRKLLAYNVARLEQTMPAEDPDLEEFHSIVFQLEHMPAYMDSSEEAANQRYRESRVAMARLAALTERQPRIREHVEENVRLCNGEPGAPESFDLLHELLESQPYRLAFWRTAMHEINYRRFFEINELAGLRMEDEEVFAATHDLIIRLVRDGWITGLRLDHVDGLFNPAGYFRTLLHACGDPTEPIYLVAEKILSTGEPLREDWLLHGTTGYEFLNDLNGLFVARENEWDFRRFYREFTQRTNGPADVVYESKKLIIDTSLAGELNVLAHQIDRISEANRRTRDFTLDSLREALREIVACFPVYRTYISDTGHTRFDEETIEVAVARAVRRNPAMETSTYEFIRGALVARPRLAADDDDYDSRLLFARRFQQYTGPVQAKGLEDTTFYRYGPLLSLNEVGGDPYRFGRSPEDFHRVNADRLRIWPCSMLATGSHDHKRGEDARARVNVLSEMPEEWRGAVLEWAEINAPAKTEVEGQPAPDPGDEYLFYQSLVGAWTEGYDKPPSEEFVARMVGYMQKATKEAKIHTSWINPAQEYDEAVAHFVRQSLSGAGAEQFRERFAAFHPVVKRRGMVNSLAQVVLKIASPGVPDFFQGSEMWDFSLVDPDNRRPVDFGLRRRLLDEMAPLLESGASAAAAVREMVEAWPDGRIKLYVTTRGLRLRRDRPDLFLEADYLPLEAAGERAAHVVALARVLEGAALIAAVPRLTDGQEGWGDTAVPLTDSLGDREWRNVLTNEPVAPGDALPVAELFRDCPVALLLSG